MKIVGGKLLYRVCLHVSMTITILAKSKHAHGTETHNLDESLAKVEGDQQWQNTWKYKKVPTTKTTQNALKYKAKTLYY